MSRQRNDNRKPNGDRQTSVAREELQRKLCDYISDTLSCIDTVGKFFDTLSEWEQERKTEVTELNKIKDEADLNSVLKKALGGLEKLDSFLDAVERLAVTSLQVFMKNKVLQLPQEISLEKVQAVINDSKNVCPFLLEFKRDDRTFFRPNIKNVEVFAAQLGRYLWITQKLCRMIKKSSVHDLGQKRIEPKMVHLAVDVSEENIQNMFGHIRQLVSIRMDQHFRLVFLFQDVSCSEFISEYSERKPRVLQFLSDLEKTAVKLDEMKLGADISGVTSSSVGAVGSVLSIIGLILAPFTAGASLGLTMTGAGLGITSGVTAVVTTTTESEVNRKNQNKANELFQNLMGNMEIIQHCLEKASFHPVTRDGVGKSDVADTVVTGVCGSGEIAKDIISFIIDLREPKPMQTNEVQIANEVEEVAQGAEAIAQMPRVAAGTGQAAARGAAALSMPVRAGFGVLNGLFLGLDIYNICKDSTSLHHGSKSEASEFIRARSALWRSELDSWQKIHDSLRQGLETSEKNKKILQKPFYPE
ncbi:apolipoprotein L4-like [Myripristis murdjan]|uniref:apolipoprotein L4-like n=1 Tax=Myripristis murdjan TaxID=586833 RepID=UPI00117600E2|nr:apolipoprotein L4-like [Myripristis murdjan]